MKTKTAGILLAALISAAAFSALFFRAAAPPVFASAASSDFTVPAYTVEMKVEENRTVDVEEHIFVSFLYPRSGIVRDFDLTGGVRYGKIEALRDGKSVYTTTHSDSSELLSLYIGEEGSPLSADTVYEYTVRYRMTVPALREEGYLPLDVIGYDWQAKIGEVSVRVTFPAGLEEYKVYSGYAGGKLNAADIGSNLSGNTLLLEGGPLGYGGVTLDLRFADGVLKAPPIDLVPLYTFLIAVGLLGVFLFLRFCICRKEPIVTTVNFTAPEEMDPLLMGKIIDNRFDSEDLGALVFWFASKGYLTIDLSEGKDDPYLIRSAKEIEEGMEGYQREFLEGLFARGTRVRVSWLGNSFYTTADRVKRGAAERVGKLFSERGKRAIGVLAALTVLLLGGFAAVFPAFTVTARYFYLAGLVVTAASFGLSAAFSCTAFMYVFKWGRKKRLLFLLGGFAVGLLPALFAQLFPSAAFSGFVPLVLAAGASALGGAAGSLLTRTHEYNERLGQVLGFREFILYTEKDRIEAMLEEEPDLFYTVLPYAQVLGVTDAWSDRFAGLNIRPPDYLYYNTADMVFDAIFFSHIFHTLNLGLARNIVMRPSNRGGGHSGGFGGGFGGGGFGGGGGRSF